MRAFARIGVISICFIAWCASATGQSANLSSLDKELTELVKKLAPSVARVGAGNSGVAISSKGLVLTDIDVVRRMKEAGKTKIDVAFAGQPALLASIAATDESTATAILRIEGNKTLPSVRPGNPEELAIGHLVMTIGNSFGSANESSPAVTLGVLASIRTNANGVVERIETSAATNPGQEGGPYFNLHGDLIGLEYSLQSGDDLATLTPIDLIVARYAAVKEVAGAFEKPRVLSPPTSLGESLSQGFAIAARKARAGVVTLVVTRADPAAELPQSFGLPARKGPVSGTIVEASGVVVAALPPFLVEATAIDAYTADGRKLTAVVLARDHKAGLAVLQLDVGDTPLAPLPIRETKTLEIGQFCLALGAPNDPNVRGAGSGFVTTGILSAKHQLDAYRDALQTDAGVGAKNAGGALIDLRSRLIGIVLPPAMPYGPNSGLGFAMPIDAVIANLPRWKSGVNCEPAMIGALLADAPSGVRVDGVTAGQPAAAAGVIAGDVITHLDGTRVLDRLAFSNYVMKFKCAGDTLKLTLTRGKDVLALSVVLAKRG